MATVKEVNVEKKIYWRRRRRRKKRVNEGSEVVVVMIVEVAVLLKSTFFCIGILPETLYFLLAFYRYFSETLDSVIFLRPRWQPCRGSDSEHSQIKLSQFHTFVKWILHVLVEKKESLESG